MKWTEEFIFSLFSRGRSPPAAAGVEEDSTQEKWDRLRGRLLSLEESLLLPPSEVRPSSWELKCLIITFQNEKSVFSPCLIITFFEHKALCCVFGVMGDSCRAWWKSCVCVSLSEGARLIYEAQWWNSRTHDGHTNPERAPNPHQSPERDGTHGAGAGSGAHRRLCVDSY